MVKKKEFTCLSHPSAYCISFLIKYSKIRNLKPLPTSFSCKVWTFVLRQRIFIIVFDVIQNVQNNILPIITNGTVFFKGQVIKSFIQKIVVWRTFHISERTLSLNNMVEIWKIKNLGGMCGDSPANITLKAPVSL
jgi:hypothetical protein